MAEEESWEDIDEDELVRRIINRQEQLTKDNEQQPQNDQKSATAYNVVNEAGPTTIQYSSEESAYVASVRILKRPDAAEGGHLKNTCQPTQQKTLAQREADYASARARIMGQTEQIGNQSKHRPDHSLQQRQNKKENEQRSILRKQ